MKEILSCRCDDNINIILKKLFKSKRLDYSVSEM